MITEFCVVEKKIYEDFIGAIPSSLSSSEEQLFLEERKRKRSFLLLLSIRW
jgi:hypothetical protein